jgi:hypothetical protein
LKKLMSNPAQTSLRQTPNNDLNCDADLTRRQDGYLYYPDLVLVLMFGHVIASCGSKPGAEAPAPAKPN